MKKLNLTTEAWAKIYQSMFHVELAEKLDQVFKK